MPNFIHCFDGPWWKINSHEDINKHASEHKLYLNLSPNFGHQICFPARKLISNTVNNGLHLLLGKFLQREGQT
jgi:hypothetical protein